MSIASYGFGHGKAKVLGLHLHPYGTRILEGLAPCIWVKLINLGWVVMACPCGDTHTNDAPEDDSYSVPDDLECIEV